MNFNYNGHTGINDETVCRVKINSVLSQFFLTVNLRLFLKNKLYFEKSIYCKV